MNLVRKNFRSAVTLNKNLTGDFVLNLKRKEKWEKIFANKGADIFSNKRPFFLDRTYERQGHDHKQTVEDLGNRKSFSLHLQIA